MDLTLWIIVIILCFNSCSMNKKIQQVEDEADYDSEVSSLKSEINYANSDIDNLESKVNSLESDVNRLKSRDTSYPTYY